MKYIQGNLKYITVMGLHSTKHSSNLLITHLTQAWRVTIPCMLQLGGGGGGGGGNGLVTVMVVLDWAQYCNLHCVMGVVVVFFPKAEVEIYILNAYIVTCAIVMVVMVVVVECIYMI